VLCVRAEATDRATWMKPMINRILWALAALAYGVATVVAFIVLLPAALIQSAFSKKVMVEDRERYLDD